jgi:hypothetical protein
MLNFLACLAPHLRCPGGGPLGRLLSLRMPRANAAAIHAGRVEPRLCDVNRPLPYQDDALDKAW